MAGTATQYFIERDNSQVDLSAEYTIDTPGLIVIARNNKFGYIGKPNSLTGSKWSEDEILETFGLSGSSNLVMLGRDLWMESDNFEPDEITFDKFMMDVDEKAKKTNPSFLLFVLMTHGIENGKFLLSDARESGCCGLAAIDAGSEKHKFEGGCHVRRFREDLVERLQSNDSFKGKPKIFLLQTCRGTKADDMNSKSSTKNNYASIYTIFTPQSADVIIIHPVSEGQLSIVGKRSGSIIVTELCAALKRLEDKVKKENSGNTSEDELDGWFHDICLEMSNIISTRYSIRKEMPNGTYKVVSKCQAEIKSKLNKKLSCIKVMRVMNPNWGK